MNVPLELSFRGVEQTPEIARKIRTEVSRLDRLARRLASCRIAVEQPQQHQERGRSYRVRIEVGLPPDERLVVRREPSGGDMHASLHAILTDAFGAMGRQVKERVRKRRALRRSPLRSPRRRTAP